MTKPPTNGKPANGQPQWGEIQRIDVHLIPPDTASEYWPLYSTLALMLERTPPNEGLYVPFPEGGERAAKQSLSLLFSRRLGKGAVRVSVGATREGIPAVFIQRGPNYPAPEPEGKRKHGKSGDDGAEVSDFD